VDVLALNVEYAKHRRAALIDYTAVLKWVVTDDANGVQMSTDPLIVDPDDVAQCRWV
jgi:hypothetical protein